MAPPRTTTTTGTTAQRRRCHPLKCIGISLLMLIVIVGIIVLVIWLAVRPRKPVYTVVSSSVRNFNLTADNHLTADFNFSIEAYNPSKRVSIYYESIEAQLYFRNEQIAFATWPGPFSQPRRNVTYLPVFLPAKDVELYGNVARNFKKERSAGKVGLEIKLNAKVRFKTGAWKSNHRKLKVVCTPTVVSYSHRHFMKAQCDVDI